MTWSSWALAWADLTGAVGGGGGEGAFSSAFWTAARILRRVASSIFIFLFGAMVGFWRVRFGGVSE